jgi:Zinc-binding dehydrogenase
MLTVPFFLFGSQNSTHIHPTSLFRVVRIRKGVNFSRGFNISFSVTKLKEWTDNRTDHMIKDYDKVVYQVKEITHGKTADVVLNSLGVNTWDSSFESVGVDERLVTFGGLTGGNVNLNIQSLIR